MKTRIRTFTKSINNKEELSPLLKWGFVVVILYALLGGLLVENYPHIYMLGLFFIFPAFCIIYLVIQSIKNKLSNRAFKYFIAFLINIFFLLLYIFTLKGFFLSIFIVCSASLLFINYIPYLEIKYQKRIIKNKEKAKYKSVFNSLLRNINFHNHHNYYQSQELKNIYNRYKIINSIKNFIITTSIFPMVVLIGGIETILEGYVSWSGYIGTFIVLFGIVAFAKLIDFIVKLVLGKLKSKDITIYQKTIQAEKHLSHRKKIFFY